MRPSERRDSIIALLCCRKHETIENLMFEFGVSERTIRRDIEILRRTEPIYTRVGRYGGGVYVAKDYHVDRQYMTDEETRLLKKMIHIFSKENETRITPDVYATLKNIVKKYGRPTIQERK